jgi:hypothetical protein
MMPAVHLPVDPRSTLAPMPDLLLRGLAVIAVFVGLLAVTRFFQPDELRRLRAIRRGSGPVAATNRAPDSSEMAGEIVATDIGVPE